MGNRSSHTSSYKQLNTQKISANARSTSAFAKVATVDDYLQPSSTTLNEYLQSRNHASEVNIDEPLQKLGYHEAYAHLCELADKQMQKLHAPIGEVDAYTTGYNAPELDDRSTNEVSLGSKNRMTLHHERTTRNNTQGLVVTEGLGDKKSPFSKDYSDSNSDDYVIRTATTNSQTKYAIHGHHRSTPYDSVPKLGDVRSQSDSSSTSEDEHSIYNEGGNLATKSKDFTFTGIRNKSPIKRNLRTVKSPSTGPVHSGINDFDKGDLQRSCSISAHEHQKGGVHNPEMKCINSHLGFQSLPDGSLSYTAFIRSGPCGVPCDGWLSDLCKRASRHLTGLHRQYRCTIQFDERIIPYRGIYVHAMVITGQSQSDIIRCRNALPTCIETHMITPYAHHGTTLRRTR